MRVCSAEVKGGVVIEFLHVCINVRKEGVNKLIPLFLRHSAVNADGGKVLIH